MRKGQRPHRVFHDAKAEAQRRKRGADFLVQVAAKLRKRPFALTFRAMRHPAPHVGEQMAVVEPFAARRKGRLAGWP
jgi:hypothetical protein